MDLKEVRSQGVDWSYLAQGINLWRDLVNIQLTERAENFLTVWVSAYKVRR
jgi:hypothetical protein